MDEGKSYALSMARVLFLSYDGLTDPLGQSQILPYLCGLADRYSITIVSFEKDDRFEKLKGSIGQVCENAGLIWRPLKYHKYPPIFSTLYDLWLAWKLSTGLHRAEPFTFLQCRSYLAALIGLGMKNRYNTRFNYDMRGFWADERVEAGLWNRKNPLYNLIYLFFKQKESSFLKRSSQIVVLTEAAHLVLRDWGIDQPIKVIPCCVDLTLFNPARFDERQRQNFRSKLGINVSDFVVGYVGSLGTVVSVCGNG